MNERNAKHICRRAEVLYLEHEGLKLTLWQWAKRKGIRASAIRARIKRGWPVADALDKTDDRQVFLEHEGLRLTISQWAKRKGLHKSTIRSRLKRGCSVADALDTPPGGKPKGHNPSALTMPTPDNQ